VSGGVFASGMLAKEDPETWEVHVHEFFFSSAGESGGCRQGKTGAEA